MTGNERRLKRLFVGEKKRCLLVPLDHGPWLGPISGIDQPREIARKVIAGGANALLVTPGFLRAIEPILGPEVGIVLRVSLVPGLSAEALQEVPSFSATTAVRMDADAVAVSIFFGRGGEVNMMRWMAGLIEECQGLGIPVIAEMIPSSEKSYDANAIAHAARIGMELGADAIKTNYCGDVRAFQGVVTANPIPIIIAGGPSKAENDTLQIAEQAIKAGAAGLAFGRRVWQSKDPERLVRNLKEIIFSL